MRFVKPSVEEITPQKYDLVSIYKHIELCGRTCYKSQDKITEESYIKFVENLKERNHLSVMEHGTVYLRVGSVCDYVEFDEDMIDALEKVYSSPYSIVNTSTLCSGVAFITTNMRVITETHAEFLLEYLCEPTNLHAKRRTFKVTCPIGVSREFNRHRVLSISEQSTRYCNYSSDKFGNELAFIHPSWLPGNPSHSNNWEEWRDSHAIKEYLSVVEELYLGFINHSHKPQEARDVLPLCSATEVIYTATESDWEKVLKLRSSLAGAKGQHPDANVIGNMIYGLLNYK